MTPFVHLHNHTEYSLLDGAQPIGRMLDKAADNGMPATDWTTNQSLIVCLTRPITV